MNKRLPAILAVIGGFGALAVLGTLGVGAGPGPATYEALATTKYEHKLGESVFVKVRGLGMRDAGNIMVFAPNGAVFKTVAYDGAVEPSFNWYFTPDTDSFTGLCGSEDLAGVWTISFEDKSRPSARFEMTSEFLEGAEKNLQAVC